MKLLGLFLVLLAAAATKAAPWVPCIESCSRRPDGDYQSCLGCHVYATCTNFKMIDNRPCPGGLVWDDNLRKCHFTSSTCPIKGTQGRELLNRGNAVASPLMDARSLEVGECIKSCEGLFPGNYPSCLGCEYFASCSNGVFTDGRPCPPGLKWDDRLKTCAFKSSTCEGSSSDQVTAGCISSCDGRPNGDYQSCQGCHVYASCFLGTLYDGRPCPENLVWDDDLKRCERESTTCPAVPAAPAAPAALSARAAPAARSRHYPCVSSCVGMPDGHYHSCYGCRDYASCSNGRVIDPRPCPAKLEWDDINKMCTYRSPTCPFRNQNLPFASCVKSCTGLPDGNYQSCLNCSVYASCVNGKIIDARPCPPGLLWNDTSKMCSYWSFTCPAAPAALDIRAARAARAAPTALPRHYPCVSSCVGMPDGDYHSCYSCHVYASCSNGRLIDRRPCPDNLEWNDRYKMCVYRSFTCPFRNQAKPYVASNSGSCIKSCTGLPDGDYQSCLNCSVYASCVNGQLTDARPCPSGTVWDDLAKMCGLGSRTCHKAVTTPKPDVETTPAGTPSTTPAGTPSTTTPTPTVRSTEPSQTTKPTPASSDNVTTKKAEV